MTDSDHDYDKEIEELRARKLDDNYDFSYEFEYIEKNHGNDVYDIATTVMSVHVTWDDAQAGYVITYEVPEWHLVDPREGNDDVSAFFDYSVENRLLADLATIGIGPELLVS